MADFQASLTDPTTGVVSLQESQCENLTFTDHSNYVSSTEAGHLQADFDEYLRITVEHHDGSSYLFSALGTDTPDEVIDAPSAQSPPTNYSTSLFSDDGVYTVTLCAIPSHDGETTYSIDDTVYDSDTGKIYRSLISSNNNSLTDTASWEVITESQVGDKYCVTERILVRCNSKCCKCDAIKKAACDIKDRSCSDEELCKNKCFQAASKLIILYEDSLRAFNEGDYEGSGLTIDLMKKICDCGCGCADCNGGC